MPEAVTTTTGVLSKAVSAAPSQVKLRLEYLDGLRGLSALYVVLYHATDPSWAEGRLPGVLTAARRVLTYGHFAVAVFIILSGYCLMMPVARSADQQLRGGFREYMRRRARRILPPYYITLLVTLALIALIPPLRWLTGTYWDGALPAFTPEALLSHLALIHNLSANWNFKINPPLWSVATEWQIYFFFPLLLLPLWRRWGLMASVGAGMLLGLAPHFLLPRAYNLDTAVPWYLGLFALGMGAAAINFTQKESLLALRARIPWNSAALLLFLLLMASALLRARWWWANLWFADTQVGLFTACLLICCTDQLQKSESTVLIRLFQSRGAVLLGTMSYSLYLMHAPLLALMHIPLHSLSVSPSLRVIAMLFVAVPLTVMIAYLFHLAFERPFMSTPARTLRVTEG